MTQLWGPLGKRKHQESLAKLCHCIYLLDPVNLSFPQFTLPPSSVYPPFFLSLPLFWIQPDILLLVPTTFQAAFPGIDMAGRESQEIQAMAEDSSRRDDVSGLEGSSPRALKVVH